MKFFATFAALALATTSAVRIQEKTEESEALETMTMNKAAAQEFTQILSDLKSQLNEHHTATSEATNLAKLEARVAQQEQWVNAAIDKAQDFACQQFGWCQWDIFNYICNEDHHHYDVDAQVVK